MNEVTKQQDLKQDNREEMKQTILSIAGRPGLYKLVSRGNNSLIVETLDETHMRRKASANELQAYFGEVLPNFDRDRVHNSDIKKLLQWYDILVKAGITDFEPETEEAEGETAEEAATEE